jgi:2-C-methyl-D-erythritol 4-phosphate cytidylyltransferase
LSVWEGLRACAPGTELVAVHDGARPLIAPDQIERCLAAAREHGAAACARPLTETLKRADANGIITGSIEREGAWIMETPQVFRLDLLTRAYEAVLGEGRLVTDEVSALQHLGAPVHLVVNDGPNPKITFAADLALAEKML